MSFVYTDPKERLGDIQTPQYVADYLFKLLKHLKPNVVLDPSCGVGNLLRPWYRVARTIGVEKEEEYIEQAKPVLSYSFNMLFEHVTGFPVKPDLVMCNPPWNRHWNHENYPEVFLKKIVELFGNKIPICFLCPMGLRLNQRKISERWRWLRDTLEISSIISCPINMYTDTEFHSEIILFNVRKVRPHYWMCEEPDE